MHRLGRLLKKLMCIRLGSYWWNLSVDLKHPKGQRCLVEWACITSRVRICSSDVMLQIDLDLVEWQWLSKECNKTWQVGLMRMLDRVVNSAKHLMCVGIDGSVPYSNKPDTR